MSLLDASNSLAGLARGCRQLGREVRPIEVNHAEGPEVRLEEVIGDRRKMLKPSFIWPPVLPLNSNSISGVNVVLLVGSAGIK